jgi:hypothetical protein
MPETNASIQIDPFPHDFGATARGLDLRVMHRTTLAGDRPI